MNTPVYPNKTLNQQKFENIFQNVLITISVTLAIIMPKNVNVNNFGKTTTEFLLNSLKAKFIPLHP